MTSLFYKLLLFFFSISSLAYSEKSFTELTVEKAKKLNDANCNKTLEQKIILCSSFQDLWLSYLYNVESKEEYHRGMELMKPLNSCFRSNCNMITKEVNFFNPRKKSSLYPQVILIGKKGEEEIYGFLNTFKTGRHILPSEREALFQKEWSEYQKDSVTDPFTLNSNTLQNLEPETVYNFALLADGTIHIALEKPDRETYYVQTTPETVKPHTHPNHTILAGSPHQLLLSAGSFLFFEDSGKRLYFVSNKSGHFIPSFSSLEQMVEAMAQLGVNRHTIILVPDLDTTLVALKYYEEIEIPLQITTETIDHLFLQAEKRWIKTRKEIDIKLLTSLASGDLKTLDWKVIEQLNDWRNEANYMRSAYNLFSASHQPPLEFNEFVKAFGRLKDAVNHELPKQVQFEAKETLKLMLSLSALPSVNMLKHSDEDSFRKYLKKQIAKTQIYLKANELSAKRFHFVKKSSRELGVLMQLMSEDARKKGEGHFLFKAAAKEFFRVNEIMAKTHDQLVLDHMTNIKNYKEVKVKPDKSVIKRLQKLLSHLSIKNKISIAL